MSVEKAAGGSNELLDLFTRYNEDWWPMHVLAYALGVAPVALLFARDRRRCDRAITALLAALWLWLGVGFQAMYATDIDITLGTVYAVLFVLQAYLLLQATVDADLVFQVRNGAAGVLGWSAIGYAVVVYPLLGAGLGHGWPESPLLGMAPCPTTILTFGMLLLARPPIPHRLLLVPLVWALLAPPAAMDRGVYEDLGLLAVGVAASGLVVLRDRRVSRAASAGLATASPDSDSSALRSETETIGKG
jgi:hypothetical protein